MQHVLDNPIWGALTTGNKHLAKGIDDIKYFDPEVSPFVGLRENSADNLLRLYNVLPHNKPVIFVADAEMDIPGKWKSLPPVRGFQMVYDGPALPVDQSPELIALTQKDVPQMLALTKLTNPGPFAERTIDFGHYKGIFDGDKLAAMTGQRLHIANYQEVSAVCTHPDYLGRGYARRLLIYHINRIKSEQGIPFLHVRYNNDRAVEVYQRLGFTVRTHVYFYYMQKNS